MRVLSEAEFATLTSLVASKTGIRVPETNFRHLRDYIGERLQALDADPSEFVSLLLSDRQEYNDFIDATTINETYFFREEKHFSILDAYVLPRLKEKKKSRYAFWSAACATGEEAISLAVLSVKHWPPVESGRFVVYASDLSNKALNVFRRGEFRNTSFREDGRRFHDLARPYFTDAEGVLTLRAEMAKCIEIHRLNLFHGDLSAVQDSLDLVLLRNALIYMDFDTRRKIVASVVKKMAEGGYLFLSSSEMPLLSHPELTLREIDGVYFFQKKEAVDRSSGVVPQEPLRTPAAYAPRTPATEATPIVERRLLPASTPLRLDVDRICDYADQKLNNRIFEITDDRCYDVAVLYLQVIALANGEEIEKARNFLTQAERLAGKNPIALYLAGYLDMRKNKVDDAVRCFSETLRSQPRFWPARYHCGILSLQRDRERALRELKTCADHIERYIAENSYLYQFLLEGFNARYFLEICRKWIRKLS